MEQYYNSSKTITIMSRFYKIYAVQVVLTFGLIILLTALASTHQEPVQDSTQADSTLTKEFLEYQREDSLSNKKIRTTNQRLRKSNRSIQKSRTKKEII